MNTRHLTFFVALLAAGCGGGHSGYTRVFDIQPRDASTPPGGTVVLSAVIVEYSVASIAWSVREGSAGGAVAAEEERGLTATYTAPIKTGTYHVDALLTDQQGRTARSNVSIVVASD